MGENRLWETKKLCMEYLAEQTGSPVVHSAEELLEALKTSKENKIIVFIDEKL
jgi:hypothetical protein